MAKNQESINRSLFELLRSRGYAPTLLDTSGKEIPVPEEAEVFQFKFTKDGEEYGTVTASIDGLHKLIIYFGDDVANSEKEDNGGDDSWYKLLNHLKRFAQQHQLSFEVKNRDHLKYDMAKREHMKKQERISEGYYPMGKKASYNDNIPTVKIVIEHSRTIEEGEQRYRNVNRIFLENTQGERILAPTTKPGVAQVYARHLAEGGMPHDDRWNHIISLCEEYNKMSAFVRATRNNQFNESAQQLVNEGINHHQRLKESLSKMRGSRGYNSYFESYTPPLMEDESEENNLNELFVQETLDPRIESVMPILSKLHKKVAEMKEVNELSEWADSLTETDLEEGDGGQQALNPAGIPEEDLDEQRFPDNSNSTAKRDMVVTNLHDLIKDPRQAHEPVRHGPDNPRVKMATKVMPSRPVGPVNKIVNPNEVEEGIVDTVKKVASKVKDVASNAFDKLGGGTEEDLIRSLQKSAGVPQTGKKPEPKDKPVGEGLDDAQQADQKINTPAVHRKEQGGDWKVTKQDLAKADEKNMTSPAGMAALKKKISTMEETVELEEDEFAGNYATGEAGQWRNKGPKANKPATIGDLVGEGEENNKLDPWKHVSPRVDNPKIKGTDKRAKSAYYPTPKPPVKKLDTPLTNETVAEGSDDLARILNIAGIKK